MVLTNYIIRPFLCHHSLSFFLIFLFLDKDFIIVVGVLLQRGEVAFLGAGGEMNVGGDFM